MVQVSTTTVQIKSGMRVKEKPRVKYDRNQDGDKKTQKKVTRNEDITGMRGGFVVHLGYQEFIILSL